MARTKAVDYDAKREMILRAAARLFAEEGYDRTSIASLAAECGMSKALLYHYYASKDALLYDVIGVHLEQLCLAIESADDPALEPEQRLRRLVGTLLEEYRNADCEHKVQINAMKFLPAERQEELRSLERRLVVIFADALKAVNPKLANGRRLLKPVTMSLFGMLNWHYMWFRPEGPISREDYAELATRLIIHGARGLT